MSIAESSPNLKNQVIIVLGHKLDKMILANFNKLKNECSSGFDVFFVFDNTQGKLNGGKYGKDYFLLTIDDLIELKYPGKIDIKHEKRWRNDIRNFKMGNTELPILYFAKHHPYYEYYWVIEYDVRFSGSWYNFFSYFSDNTSDLLCTTLMKCDLVKNWSPLNSLYLPDKQLSPAQIIRGFFPVYRISRRALDLLDQQYILGCKGHYECLMPTVIKNAGMHLEDIGGNGEFVNKNNINKFYHNTTTGNTLSPGTFVYRPVYRNIGKELNKLWHPVKYTPLWKLILRPFRKLYMSLKRKKSKRKNVLICT